MSRQYPLPLPHREAMEAGDFMVTASNSEAAAWLDKWPEWPSHCLVIYGQSGAGKTHLATMWKNRAHGELIAGDEVAVKDIGILGAGPQTIAVDNAESVARNSGAEEALLHLYNLLRENKGYLLLTAVKAPAQWQIDLPDLRSRLLTAPAIELAAPDDELVSGLLIKQMRDRQIDVGMDVIDFIVPRLTRSTDAVRTLVTALDRASLAAGRRITVPLARGVLEDLGAPAKDVDASV